MVRERDPEMLDGWLEEASASRSPELQGFAEGLRSDHGAVRAALSERWSNGQVEGSRHGPDDIRKAHGARTSRS